MSVTSVQVAKGAEKFLRAVDAWPPKRDEWTIACRHCGCSPQYHWDGEQLGACTFNDFFRHRPCPGYKARDPDAVVSA